MRETVQNIDVLKELMEKHGLDPEAFFPACVGCGYCCLQATCSLGVKLWNPAYPCQGLFWDGERYRCRLAKDFGDKLYIGSGCCSPMNDWRKGKIIEQRDQRGAASVQYALLAVLIAAVIVLSLGFLREAIRPMFGIINSLWPSVP